MLRMTAVIIVLVTVAGLLSSGAQPLGGSPPRPPPVPAGMAPFDGLEVMLVDLAVAEGRRDAQRVQAMLEAAREGVRDEDQEEPLLQSSAGSIARERSR